MAAVDPSQSNRCRSLWAAMMKRAVWLPFWFACRNCMRSWPGGGISRRGLAGWRDHTSPRSGISAQRKNGSPDTSQARQGQPIDPACRYHRDSLSKFRNVGSTRRLLRAAMTSPQAAVLSLRSTMVICARLFRAHKETPPPVCQRGSLGDDTQQSQKEEEIDFSSRSGPSSDPFSG